MDAGSGGLSSKSIIAFMPYPYKVGMALAVSPYGVAPPHCASAIEKAPSGPGSISSQPTRDPTRFSPLLRTTWPAVSPAAGKVAAVKRLLVPGGTTCASVNELAPSIL